MVSPRALSSAHSSSIFTSSPCLTSSLTTFYITILPYLRRRPSTISKLHRLMPLTDSPPISSPYTNSLPPTS